MRAPCVILLQEERTACKTPYATPHVLTSLFSEVHSRSGMFGDNISVYTSMTDWELWSFLQVMSTRSRVLVKTNILSPLFREKNYPSTLNHLNALLSKMQKKKSQIVEKYLCFVRYLAMCGQGLSLPRVLATALTLPLLPSQQTQTLLICSFAKYRSTTDFFNMSVQLWAGEQPSTATTDKPCALCVVCKRHVHVRPALSNGSNCCVSRLCRTDRGWVHSEWYRR